MLAVGLLEAISDTRVLYTFEWWHRQLCDRRYRILHVQIGCRGRKEGRWVDRTLFCSILTSCFTPDKQVISDARRIAGEPDDSSYIPSDPKEFSSRIFHTCYMGTENSSAETRRRAKQLAEAIGRYADILPMQQFINSKRSPVTIRISTWTA